jgi:hypothetical protein
MTKSLKEISRDEMAEAGLSAFFGIAGEWDLSNEEARTLLGNPSRSRFYKFRRGKLDPGHRLSVDELDRLAYITGIYALLNSLYAPDSHGEWLRNNSQVPADALYRPWGLGSPLDYMLTGKLIALADIYEYINVEQSDPIVTFN